MNQLAVQTETYNEFSEFKKVKNYAVIKSSTSYKAIILHIDNYDYVATVSASCASKLNVATRAAIARYDKWMGNPIGHWGRVMVTFDDPKLF